MEESFVKTLSIIDAYEVASQICNGIDYNDDLFGFWKADLLAEGMFQLKLSPDKLENFFAWFNYLEKCLAWSKDCDRKKLFSELRQLVLRCSDYLHLQFPQPPQSVLPCIPVPKKSIETNLQSISSVNQSSKSIKESRSQLRTPDSVDQIWKAPTPTASFGVMNTASTTTKESSDQITPSPAASRHSGYLKQVTSTTKPSLDQMQSSSISKKNLEQIHTSSKAISLSSKDSRDGHISTTAQEPLNLISPISSISKDSRALVKDVSTSKQNVDNISGTSKKSSYNEMTNSMFFQEVQQLHSAMRRNSENKKTNLEDFVNIMEVLYSIFANPFCFELVKRTQHRTKQVIKLPLPYNINLPMTLAPPEETPSKKGKVKGKDSKKGKKGKDVEKKEKKSVDKGKKGKGKEKKEQKEEGEEQQQDVQKEEEQDVKEKKGKEKKGKEKKDKEKKGKEKKGKEKKGKEKKGKEKKGKEKIMAEEEVDTAEPMEPLAEEQPSPPPLPELPVSEPEPPAKLKYLQPLQAAVNDAFFENLFKEEFIAKASKKKDKKGKKEKGGKGSKKKGKK